MSVKAYLYYKCPGCEKDAWLELVDVRDSGEWWEARHYACMDCAYTAQYTGGRNMLHNPEFGPPFEGLPKYSSIVTAEHWHPWWDTGNLPWSADFPFEQGAAFRQPEFKAIPQVLFPKRVPVGTHTQCLFTVHGPMWAGVCQDGIPVPQGRTIKFGFKVQAWCSMHEDPYGRSEGEMYARLLLRHGGGRRWDPGWEWHPSWVPIGLDWKSLEWELVAERAVISVGIAFWGKWPLKHNDGYISDAWMRVQGEPAPAPDPDPEPTPDPPTSDEIHDAKVWIVKKQLAIAEGVVADWQSVLVDLEQPKLLGAGLRRWVGGLVASLRREKAETSLLGVRSELDKTHDFW